MRITYAMTSRPTTHRRIGRKGSTARTVLATLALILGLGASAIAQTAMPTPLFSAFDANGDPMASAKLCVYVTGTSTPADTYTDATLVTANANPVVMNSAGRAPVFLRSGSVYKFVLRAAGSS